MQKQTVKTVGIQFFNLKVELNSIVNSNTTRFTKIEN